MATQLDDLQLEVKSNSAEAAKGIEALSSSLSKLKSVTKGGIGLTSIVNQVKGLDSALQSFDGSASTKIDKLAESLNKIKSIGSIRISSSIGNQLKKLDEALGSLDTKDYSGITGFTDSLKNLNEVGSAKGLRSSITQLQKLPDLQKQLDAVDFDKLTGFMDSLKNLNEVGSAKGLRSSITQLQKLPSATKSSHSYTELWAKLHMVKSAARMVGGTIADWITTTNEYIEDVNLFTASMGEYASEAQKYAEQVGNIMGIDPGQFMRYEGIFNTIIEGFGVASDKAYLMSKNLTQLGYDLSSFYNISFEDAMTKLQSGISGELEPLRRLGYDLSVARLQQEAYNLGIEKSVSDMTQAEKSQLRYYAIMTQVTTAQGDMARTLNAPANQMRVLRAQVIQLARALGEIFIPVLNAVLPYAIALAKALRLVAEQIAQFFGYTLPEVDYSGIGSDIGVASTNAGDLADNASDAGDSIGNAAKQATKLKKSLLSIDELHVIPSNDDSDTGSGSTGGGGVGVGGGGGDLGIDLPQYDFLGDLIDQNADALINKIKDVLSIIMGILGGSFMAIGAILTFTGANIPLGIAMMVIGAAEVVTAVALNWDSMTKPIAEVLSTLLSVLGGFLLVLGAIFTFSGANVPLGIGLMVAGAVSIATAVAIDWKFLDHKFSTILSTLMGIVSGGLLAIGVLLVATGATPGIMGLGIGMIVAGAVGLANVVAINWDAMPNSVKKVINTLGIIVGSALLAIGAILTFSGTDLPLGIGLMASGALTAFGSAASLDWSSTTNTVKGKILEITNIVSAALIGLGAIIALSGVNKPLGISMMAAGAVGLVASASLNWGSISESVKGVIKEIGTYVGTAILALGVILAAAGFAKVGIPMIAAGATTLVSSVALNWDELPNKVKSMMSKILAIAGMSAVAIGLIMLAVPSLIPKGIALIAGGITATTTAVALNWDSITSTVEEGLDTISEKFGEFKDTVGDHLKTAGEKISDFAGDAKDTLSEAGEKIKEKAGDIGDGIKTGISDKFDDAKDFVKEHITDPLNDAIDNADISKLSVSMKDSSAEWWSDTKKWWKDKSKGGLSMTGFISLAKKGWKTVKGWIGDIPTLDQAIELVKKKWTSVKKWIGDIPVLSQSIKLIKSGWTSVKRWIGNIPKLSQPIGLIKSGWRSVKSWIGRIDIINQAISLIKHGWSTISNFIGTAASVGISLWRDGWTSISSWIGTKVSVGISLFKSGWRSLKSFFGLSTGGYSTGKGFKLFEKGGYMKNGFSSFWKSVPKYANGTSSAGVHGSVFVAGENGTEMVGRINGQTEVLNKSQIQLAMRSAVISGMSQFTGYWRNINSTLIRCANAVISANIAGTNAVNELSVSEDRNQIKPKDVQTVTNDTTSVNTDIDGSVLRSAMYEALIMAYGDIPDDKEVKVTLDGDVIYKKVVQKNNEHVKQTGESEFNI